MRIGTSLRFTFPTSERTLAMYQARVAALPKGAFIERPMGAYGTDEQARNLEAVVRAADHAGLWAVLAGDHHNVAPQFANCFQPIPTIARLSAFAGSMAVGAVLLAPFYRPALLAEQIATVAAFTGGPTLWAFAVGDRQGAFDGHGIDRSSRGRVTGDLLVTIRRLLAGEVVTETGKPGALQAATVSPLPPHPPLLLGCGRSPGAIRRAAALADGWLTSQNSTDDELRRELDAYREACAALGKVPLPILRRDLHVAATDEAARRHIDPILAEGYRGVGYDELIVGSPASVTARLRAYFEHGFEHVMIRHITGDHPSMLESFALLGSEVVPEAACWTGR